MAYHAMSWHPGEVKIQKVTRVPHNDNPTIPGLAPRAASQIAIYPLLAIGTVDNEGRPWTTLWGGEPPFAQQIARGGIIGIRTNVDANFDPVVQALVGTSTDGEVKQSEGNGAMVSLLTIDLVKRSRWKLYGRMVVGSLNAPDPGNGDANVGSVQIVLKIEQSLGNCPKYLNKKIIHPKLGIKPILASDDIKLSPEAVELVHRADMFFISSAHEDQDMDTNHRGGPPGFIRVEQPQDGSLAGSVIVWPEYSGNNLYQTLGNLMTTPRAGLAIPDFETGDVLYLTGETEVLVDEMANALMAKSKLAVRLTITAARLVKDGLPFRGQPAEDGPSYGRSPYNPRIRYLRSEREAEFSKDYSVTDANETEVTAKMIKRTKLTPTITKYRFSLSDPSVYGPWKPGQYCAFDFGSELDMGYSHMRDDDPLSINDDYIRTFTVSSSPDSLGVHGEEFEIVIRTVGSVTNWLRWQREGQTEVGIRGFGGSFRFENGDQPAVFIAAGVGITPLLGQARVVKNLSVRWTCSIRDIGLVADVLESCSAETKKQMIVYLTGTPTSSSLSSSSPPSPSSASTSTAAVTAAGLTDKFLSVDEKALLDRVTTQVRVEQRRMTKDDLVGLLDTKYFYLCTAPALRNTIQTWLPGTQIIFENFNY